MLSIAKIQSPEGSAAHYYAEEIRVEDYYLKGQEAPGRWHGGEGLGLNSTVTLPELKRMMAGEHPKTGERLVGRGGKGRERNPGWDMTFSAPKSVSVIYAAGGDDLKAKIKLVHDRAVTKAMEYASADCLEHAGRTVSKKGKQRIESTIAVKELIYAEFFHRTSRDLDPQLHTHCVVPNVAQRVDGKWCAPNLKQVFREKKGIGAMYRAELAQGMRALNFNIEKDREFFRVAGVPLELEKELSKRREQIEAHLRAEGLDGAKDASRATLLTRKRKKLVDEKTLYNAWQKISADFGLDKDKVQDLQIDKGPSLTAAQHEKAKLILETFKELSHGDSTFPAEAIKAKFIEKAQTVMTSDQIKATFTELFRSDELLKLQKGRDGYMRYTTKDLRALEEKILADVELLKKTPDHGVSNIHQRLADFETAQSAERGRTISLSPDQREAAAHAMGPGRIKVVAGMAGAGKTFSMEAVARGHEHDGFRVSGLAPTGRAAAQLSAAKIPTQTIDKYLRQREMGGSSLGPKDVVIIDEAGLIGSRKMMRLLSEIERSGAKAILLGEAQQLQPIEAGGIFKAISDRIGSAGLTTIVRQEVEWQKQAVRHFRAGEAKEALSLYQAAGQLSIEKDGSSLINSMIKEHVRIATEKSDRPVHVVSISKTNAFVDQLNHGIRERLKAEGFLSTDGFEIKAKLSQNAEPEKLELTKGDKVVFLRNDTKLGLQNGLLAEVTGFDKTSSIVRYRDETGKDHSINMAKYPYIRHAYAITAYKSQGSTFTHTLVHATPDLSREETYVEMSRQKVDAKLFVSEEAFEVKLSELSPKAQDIKDEPEIRKVSIEEQLAKALSRSGAKDVSTNFEVTAGQIYRTERLEQLAKELPKMRGEKRIETLAEIAASHGGVSSKYESPNLSPPWQAKAREVLALKAYDRAPEVSKEILDHAKGSPSLTTERERESLEQLKREIAPIREAALNHNRSQSRAQSMEISR